MRRKRFRYKGILYMQGVVRRGNQLQIPYSYGGDDNKKYDSIIEINVCRSKVVAELLYKFLRDHGRDVEFEF